MSQDRSSRFRVPGGGGTAADGAPGNLENVIKDIVNIEVRTVTMRLNLSGFVVMLLGLAFLLHLHP
jgi:hypothetical protein